MIPQGVTEILSKAFYQSELEVIEFEANSQLETIGEGVSYFPPCNLGCARTPHIHIPNK